MTDNSDRRFESADSEREIERENAAREARIEQARREEIVQWALARAAELRRAEHEATLPKATPAPTRRPAAPARTVGMSEAWTDYIDKRDGATVRACMAAVGEVIGKDIVALEQRCAALEAELAAMRDRELGRRLRAVPASAPAAMIA